MSSGFSIYHILQKEAITFSAVATTKGTLFIRLKLCQERNDLKTILLGLIAASIKQTIYYIIGNHKIAW